MDDLLKHAMIGTTKLEPKPVGEGFVGKVQALPGLSNEKKLLLQNAVKTNEKLAGLVLETTTRNLVVPPEETRRLASGRLCEILVEILTTSRGLYPEALEKLADAKLVLTPASLPTILEQSSKSDGPLLSKVIGQRGHWLCQFNSDWKKKLDGELATQSLPADADRQWDEGTVAERKALLKLARTTDTAKSRTWLAKCWEQEKAETRIALLEVLEPTVEHADMPFLEGLTSDASKRVKTLAAQMLCKLPGSSTAAKVIETVASWLHFVPATKPSKIDSITEKTIATTTGIGKFAISLPSTFNENWTDYGVTEKPAANVSKKSHWYQQMLKLVPPSHWSSTYKQSPAVLILAAQASEEGLETIEAWTTAAITFQDHTWLPVLWDYWYHQRLKKNEHQRLTNRWNQLTELLKHLRPDDAEVRLITILTDSTDEAYIAVDQLFVLLPRPWSEDFTKSYLRFLRESAAGCDRFNYSSYSKINSLLHAATCIPPATFDLALADWQLPEKENYVTTHWRDKIREFAMILQLRQRFLKELNTVTSTS